MTYDGARNIWRRIQKRSGVEHVGSHQVRYTVVQSAAKKGATLAQCQSILNHTTPTMAMHYLGQSRDQIEADENMQWSLSSVRATNSFLASGTLVSWLSSSTPTARNLLIHGI